ncbi:MAG: SMC family ATPase [Lactobacillus sp.]|nr:SMC family ATPase [Lactobacillus sp.]
MKPLKLVLKNFGPYENETIDFQKLDQVPLFLISGRTGSGKSTIFDAMTFALYGDSATSDRPAPSLRSDFAAPTEATVVTLDFSHQGKIYHITRWPKQILAKKRGDGVTTQNNAAKLQIFQGDEKIEDTGKLKDINILINQVLQINKEQFAQIVLLPQGDFRRFLTASSNDKEAVLRKLFKTQLFEKWAEALKDQLRQAKQDNENWRLDIESNLKQIQWFPKPDNLKELTTGEQIAQLEIQQKGTEAEITTLNQQQTKIQDQIQAQKTKLAQQTALNEHIQTLAQVQAQRQAHDGQKAAMAQVQQQVAALQWAQGQKDTDQRFTEAKAQAADLAQQQAAKTADLKAQQAQLATAQSQLKILQAQDSVQKHYQEDAAVLQQQRPYFEQVASLTQALTKQQQATTTQTQQVAATQTKLTQLNENLEAFTKVVAALPGVQVQLAQQGQQEAALAHHQQTLAQLTQAQADLGQLQAKVSQQQTVSQQLTQAATAAQGDYRALKNQWLTSQIANLAQQLEPGSPCPVCGSTDHPKPAVVTATVAVSQEAVDAAEAALQQAQKQATASTTALESLTEQVTAQTADLTQNLADFQAELQQAGLGQLADLAAMKTALQQRQAELVTQKKALLAQVKTGKMAELQQADLQKEITATQAALVTQEQAVQQAQAQHQKITVQLADAQQQLPAGFEDLAALEAHLTDLKQKIATYSQALSKAQQAVNDLSQQVAASESQLAMLTQQVAATQDKVLALEQQLTLSLTEHFGQADWTQFKTLLGQLGQLPTLTQQVQQYQELGAKLATEIETYTKLVGTQTTVDLSQGQAHLATLQQQQTQLAADLKQRSERQVLNHSILTRVQARLATIAQKAAAFNELQALVDAIAGSGAAKLSLERYVLREYLLEILNVANAHLNQLSAGRYYLQLHKEAGTYQKTTGLEIDVYDDNVGKARSVHTLSGGESFIAALSLALALGEVIQNKAGGISIDTLFIDEGFGSLDQDALGMAMDALEHIEGDHRMIGIISHVAALKEQIPYQIQVSTVGQGKSHAKLILPG